jgi:hypothetical protein
MNKLIAALLVSFSLVACGGGGSTSGFPGAPQAQKLIGEVFAVPSEIGTAEIQSSAGYAGNLPMSRAIHSAGKQNLLDMLFMFAPGDALGRPRANVAPDAEQQLIQYANANNDLLVPGVRVLISDEVFWNTTNSSDSSAALQPQLDALKTAVAMVRKHIPAASIGITVTPYATFGRPNTLNYITQAISVVDWVGTDPYWLGDPTNVQSLHAWSRTFHSLAKQANPKVETWFIAQAFRMPPWDLGTFNSFIATQLGYADQYDNILFFGWQFVSEIDVDSAGRYFAPETKLLYQKYLKK